MRRRSSRRDDAKDERELFGDADAETLKIMKSGTTRTSLKKVFMICLILRVVNALLVRTYFNPDEHWQSLEVAHHIVFGYGHLTWEWREGIRSYLHPLIFALLYKFLWFFGLDSYSVMVRVPRVYQSVFAAIGDMYFYRLSCSIFEQHIANWALFSVLTNWFMFYCITRTLSNSLETVITIMAIYYWPSLKCEGSPSCERPTSSRKFSLILAALSCVIRPTGAIIFLYLGILHLFQTPNRFKFIFMEVFPIGSLVLALASGFDRWMYGSWVSVPLNFVRFNFLSSGGDYYGTHKWHWYFTQGFPTMMFTFAPFSIAGIWQSKQWKLAGLIAWVLGIYSILGHKEFRFVLPILSIALMFSGYTLGTIAEYTVLDTNLKKAENVKKVHCLKSLFYEGKKWTTIFLLLTNVPMALYMSMVHQRGSEDAMAFLANVAAAGKVKSVLFLMPCHSTPYYSTLHQNLHMRFLDCSPSNEEGYVDESDLFLSNPATFASHMALNWSQPSHILLFDSAERHLRDFLASYSYKQIGKFFHSHFKVDRDLQAAVLLYALVDD